MKFAAERYTAVPSMPRTSFGLTNYDRLHRVAEMKLLAIEFFRIFSEDPSAIGGKAGNDVRALLRELLQTPDTADPVRDYLRSLAPISEPDEPQPDEGAPAAASAESLERSARDELTRLRFMITDLDLLITQYPAEDFDDSAAGAAARAEADELLSAIQELQGAIQAQYESTQKLAVGATAVSDELKSLADRIRRLLDWPPPAWKYYGPPAPDSAASVRISSPRPRKD
jgi:hypothetical protein